MLYHLSYEGLPFTRAYLLRCLACWASLEPLSSAWHPARPLSCTDTACCAASLLTTARHAAPIVRVLMRGRHRSAD